MSIIDKLPKETVQFYNWPSAGSKEVWRHISRFKVCERNNPSKLYSLYLDDDWNTKSPRRDYALVGELLPRPGSGKDPIQVIVTGKLVYAIDFGRGARDSNRGLWMSHDDVWYKLEYANDCYSNGDQEDNVAQRDLHKLHEFIRIHDILMRPQFSTARGDYHICNKSIKQINLLLPKDEKINVDFVGEHCSFIMNHLQSNFERNSNPILFESIEEFGSVWKSNYSSKKIEMEKSKSSIIASYTPQQSKLTQKEESKSKTNVTPLADIDYLFDDEYDPDLQMSPVQNQPITAKSPMRDSKVIKKRRQDDDELPTPVPPLKPLGREFNKTTPKGLLSQTNRHFKYNTSSNSRSYLSAASGPITPITPVSSVSSTPVISKTPSDDRTEARNAPTITPSWGNTTPSWGNSIPTAFETVTNTSSTRKTKIDEAVLMWNENYNSADANDPSRKVKFNDEDKEESGVTSTETTITSTSVIVEPMEPAEPMDIIDDSIPTVEIVLQSDSSDSIEYQPPNSFITAAYIPQPVPYQMKVKTETENVTKQPHKHHKHKPIASQVVHSLPLPFVKVEATSSDNVQIAVTSNQSSIAEEVTTIPTTDVSNNVTSESQPQIATEVESAEGDDSVTAESQQIITDITESQQVATDITESQQDTTMPEKHIDSLGGTGALSNQEIPVRSYDDVV